MTGRPRAPWWARLGLLAVALGIVAMHHLAGTCACGGTDGAALGPAAASMPGMPGMSGTAVSAAAPGTPVATAPTAAVPAAPTVGAPTGHGSPSAVDLTHLCLAVLLAAVAALALALLGGASSVAGALLARRVPRWSGGSRAPPLSRRLAQLQLLRI